MGKHKETIYAKKTLKALGNFRIDRIWVKITLYPDESKWEVVNI
jgi:hypothetical protein